MRDSCPILDMFLLVCTRKERASMWLWLAHVSWQGILVIDHQLPWDIDIHVWFWFYDTSVLLWITFSLVASPSTAAMQGLFLGKEVLGWRFRQEIYGYPFIVRFYKLAQWTFSISVCFQESIRLVICEEQLEHNLKWCDLSRSGCNSCLYEI